MPVGGKTKSSGGMTNLYEEGHENLAKPRASSCVRKGLASTFFTLTGLAKISVSTCTCCRILESSPFSSQQPYTKALAGRWMGLEGSWRRIKSGLENDPE